MKILVERFDSGSKDTLGKLYIDGKFYAYTLEDEKRVVKVKGETRIPAGEYTLKLNKALTPLTEKYRAKYVWFKWHIEVTNVPGFQCVYIHIGNTEKNTDACLLLGMRIGNIEGQRAVLDSVNAFKKFYELVYPKLESGEEIKIKYMDIG